MKKRIKIIFVTIFIPAVFFACQKKAPSEPPAPEPEDTPVYTATASPTITLTPTTTQTQFVTGTRTMTNTVTETHTNTPTYTATGTFTGTSTATPTYTATGTFTHTFAATSTFTGTSTATATLTPTVTHGGDMYEPDDVYTSASTIIVNGGGQSHTTHDSDNVDWLKFDAINGNDYTIETYNLDPDQDTMLYLFDTDGTTQLDLDDDSGDGLASKISWTCPSDGTYFIKEVPYGADDLGPYDISVTSP